MPREMEDTRALFDGWAASYEQGLQNPQGPLEGHALSSRSYGSIPKNRRILVDTSAWIALLICSATM